MRHLLPRCRALGRTSVLMLLPALVAVLPVAALSLLSLRDMDTKAMEQATASLRARVERLSNEARHVVHSAERATEYLAEHPMLRRPSAGSCEGLQGAEQLSRMWARVAVLDLQGLLICESRSPTAVERQSYVGEPWLSAALHSRRAVVGTLEGPPELGLHVASAIRDASGKPVGIALVQIDLFALSESIGKFDLPDGASLSLSDRADRAVARWPNPARWIGAGSMKAGREAFLAKHPSGLGEAVAPDGVRRLYLDLPVPEIGWHAVGGVPLDAIRQPVQYALRDSVWALVTALLAGVMLASLLARRISRPLEDLSQTARAVAEGALSARATVPPGGELRAVARQFNRMLDLRQRVEEDLRDTGRLFEAMARANAALGRGGTFEQMARDMCRAGVDNGLAMRLAVLVPDGPGCRIVGGAGEDSAEWRALEERWTRGDFIGPNLPLTAALATGEPQVCNEIDWSRQHPYRQVMARALGVEAIAAWPLRLEQRTWGALLALGRQPKWFDTARLRLMEMIANDLVHALHSSQLEAARRRAESELRERDRQLGGIVESALDAVITVNADGRILVFNNAAARMFGVPAMQALGQPIRRFIPSAGFDDDSCGQHTARRELTALRADGTPFPVEASIARHGTDAQPLATAFIRDLSDAVEAEHARTAQLEAEAANHAKTLFLANVSHELRTPIHAILGFADLALRTELDERQYSYLQKATLAADALLAVVDQILDFCDLEAGKLTMSSEDFSPRDLVEPLRTGVGQRARARQLDFHIEIDPSLPARLRGDRARLFQVLANLAGNAVKFTSSGRVTLELQAGAWRGDTHRQVQLLVTVRDTGIGMAPSELDRIFEPFSQSDDSLTRRFGGTGLGLAISRQVVVRMGGTLQVDSSPGRGSEFRFAVWMEALGGSESQALPAPRPRADALRGLAALVVDDNPVNLELAGAVLRDVAQMDVATADGGQAALALLSERRFDVVVLDLQMPGMDGYEVARTVRSNPAWDAMPIVALTAFASEDVRRACLQAGMDDCLGKAAGEVVMMETLARAIEGKRAR